MAAFRQSRLPMMPQIFALPVDNCPPLFFVYFPPSQAISSITTTNHQDIFTTHSWPPTHTRQPHRYASTLNLRRHAGLLIAKSINVVVISLLAKVNQNANLSLPSPRAEIQISSSPLALPNNTRAHQHHISRPTAPASARSKTFFFDSQSGSAAAAHHPPRLCFLRTLGTTPDAL